MAAKAKAKKKSAPTADDNIYDVDKLRRGLKHVNIEPQFERLWLDTGDRYLNGVLGSPEKGVPYGEIVELYGWEQHGKTLLAQELAAIAQDDGAGIVWVDLEHCFDPSWALRWGLDPERVALLQPYIGKFGDETRLATGEEIFAELEAWIGKARTKFNKLFAVIDSVAGIVPDEEASTSLEDYTARTRWAHATLLGSTIKRWSGLMFSSRTLLILINQIRINPMAMFGSPERTPGGNATRFFASTRVKVVKYGGEKGLITKNGRKLGIKGELRNFKNKVGHGSGEIDKVMFRFFFEAGEAEFSEIDGSGD